MEGAKGYTVQIVRRNATTMTYETELSPDEEKQFQSWKDKHAPNDSGKDYDLRGAFRAGITPGKNGHWPDTFKKPNHPTFSDESIYAKDVPRKAGHWLGSVYVPTGFAQGGLTDVGSNICTPHPLVPLHQHRPHQTHTPRAS